MHRTALLVVLAIVVIAVVGYLYWRAHGYTKTTSKAGIWDPAVPPNAYTCGATTVPNYCIIPTSAARATCSADPACIGYLTPPPSSNWAQSNPGMSQLVSDKPTAGGPPGTVYYQKASA